MKTIAMLGMATMTAVMGRSALDAREGASTTNESPLTNESDAWKAVPLKQGTELVLHAEHTYDPAQAAKCGPGYSVDVLVDFGAVTSETIEVQKVVAFFLPRAGESIVPRKLDVVEIESASGRAPSERACRQTTRFVFYPQGAR